MNTTELAQRMAELCASGQFEAARELWSDDVVSVESFPGPHQVCEGRDAVIAKQTAWNQRTTMHSVRAEGPFVHGEQFALRLTLDCTGPDGRRGELSEIALFTVKDGSIVEERFFPIAGS